jgi:hypothetical protein
MEEYAKANTADRVVVMAPSMGKATTGSHPG